MTSNPENEVRAAILKEFGVEHLPEKEQQEALAAAFGPIIQSVTLGIMTALPEGVRAEFGKALTGGDSVTVEKLINAHIPNPDEFIGGEVRKAVAEFKSILAAQK